MRKLLLALTVVGLVGLSGLALVSPDLQNEQLPPEVALVWAWAFDTMDTMPELHWLIDDVYTFGVRTHGLVAEFYIENERGLWKENDSFWEHVKVLQATWLIMAKHRLCYWQDGQATVSCIVTKKNGE